LESLHKSQMAAYRDAAIKGLREWVQSSAPLAPMEENDTESAFVDRCAASIQPGASNVPNWKIDAASKIISMEMRKRARATFLKYHPPAEKGAQTGTEDEDEEGEVDEHESAEDGEMEEAGEEAEDSGPTNQSKTTEPKKKKANTNTTKRKGKAVVAKKKGTTAKANANRKGGPSNRGRRGGRGGGTKSN